MTLLEEAPPVVVAKRDRVRRWDGVRATLDSIVVVALGAALVSGSFAMSRAGVGWSTAVFWLGHALMALPVLVRVVSARGTGPQRVAVIAAGAAAQALVAFCYSPDRFRYPDELQHVRTAEDILSTGHLFTVNSMLPVSPGFPGLEIVTTAVMHLTGLSLFDAGILTAAVAHVLLPACVVLLVREWTTSARIACAAAVLFGMSPHTPYFGSLWIYETLALPFLVLAVRAMVRACRGTGSAVAVVPPLAVVLVSHHLTALVTLAFLVAAVVVSVFSGVARRRVLAAACVLLALAAVAAVWILHVAPSTVGYLGAPLSGIVSVLRSPLRDSSGGASSTGPAAASWETLVTAGSALLTGLLVLAGGGFLLRRRRSGAIALVAVLGLAYPAVLAVRVLAPDGPELAGRAMTYAMLLACLPAATALGRLVRRRSGRLAATAVLAVLSTATITAGLPPAWERLPGAFHITGAESGVDASVTAAGTWAARSMPAHQRVGCDVTVCSVLAAYAHEEQSTHAETLFTSTDESAARSVIQNLALQTVFVDQRMTEQAPVTGTYFFFPEAAGFRTSPLPVQAVTKLDEDPLLDRIYDNGNIRGYAVERVWHG